MDPFYRFSVRVWRILVNLPRLRLSSVDMPLTLLLLWTALSLTSTAPETAFVWSVVAAMVVRLCRTIPAAIKLRPDGTSRDLYSVVAIIVVLFVVQLLFLEPVLIHRMISVICLFYLAGCILGINGDQDFANELARFKRPDVTPNIQRQLLRVKAVLAILVLIITEGLLLHDVALSARVAVFALVFLSLPYFLFVVFWLTCPSHDDDR